MYTISSMSATTRRRFTRHLIASMAAACAIGTYGAPAAAQADATPEALIERLTHEALDVVNTDAAVRAGDPQRLRVLVDTRLMPHLEFRQMAASATGAAWRGATPQQRARLEEEFKALLVRLLSGALAQARASGSLAEARGKQVVVLPSRDPPDATDVTVRTQLRGSGAEPIQLDYRLHKTDGDPWMVYDVNVLGVWMVQQYRSQFAPVIRERGVQGLIESLAQQGKGAAR